MDGLLRQRDPQALAGLDHRGVEGVEPLDAVDHRPHLAVAGELTGDAPQGVAGPTTTVRVGVGVPGCSEAEEPAPSATPRASTATSEARKIVSRPRRVSRTCESAVPATGRTAAVSSGAHHPEADRGGAWSWSGGAIVVRAA